MNAVAMGRGAARAQARPRNVAALVLANARALGERTALVVPRATGADGDAEVVSFRAFGERVDSIAQALRDVGSGDRAVLLMPISVDFYATAIALLARGATVVLLDGALGVRRALGALDAARPKLVVGARALVKLWPLFPPLWRARRLTSDAACFGAATLASIVPAGAPPLEALARGADDEGLLTFTSGTSGRPKGADRTHGILLAQHEALSHEAPHAEGDVDMTCFPAVALHNLCCGMTTVLPPIDLRHPASADAARVLRAMDRWGVTRLSGAPAFMRRVLAAADAPMRRVRVVAIGGAPVGRKLAARTCAAFPDARNLVLYGSTEAEPIASAPLADVAHDQGEGYLVGDVAPIAEVEIVRLPAGARDVASFRVDEGEVLVRGPHVNRRYIGDEASTRALKVKAEDGSVWHRTGDLARRDARGRLRLTGRLADVVQHRGRAVSPYPIEAELDALDGVDASALIAHDAAPDGELLIEGRADALPRARALLAARGLDRVKVEFVHRLPVDARHESKIDRVALRARRGGRR